MMGGIDGIDCNPAGVESILVEEARAELRFDLDTESFENNERKELVDFVEIDKRSVLCRRIRKTNFD